MEQVRDFSDERISSRCCFCGGDGSTGDHVPSKAFFDEPFPENLMIVRCCKECNNSFSADEEYAACVIEVARCGSLDVEREKVKRMLAHNQTGCAGVLSAAEVIRTSVSARVNDSKIEKIIGKIARGLATFLAGMWVSDLQCEMMILPKLSHEERMAFGESQGHEVWPEVGSRLMQMMVVCDHDVLMPQWEVCQKDRFRYLIIQKSDYCEVRIVFSEYLGVIAKCA